MLLRKLSRRVLNIAEKLYLLTNGWEYMGDDKWDAPIGYPTPKDGVTQGHAINSAKQWDRRLARDLKSDVSWLHSLFRRF